MRRILLVFASLLVLVVPALAEEWVVGRVRGAADIQEGSQGWVPLERGTVVETNQLLRTGPDGRVGLVRGTETIELEGNTLISLQDAGAEMMTSVTQRKGTIVIDVEKRNVQHFSVQTPYLVAVVKGTRFAVVVDGNAARVDVDRGVVQVQDTSNDLVSDVRPGQQATVSDMAPLNVTGPGAAAVFTFEGVPVVPGTTEPVAEAATASPTNANPAGVVPGAAARDGVSGPPAQSSAGGNGNGGQNHGNAGSNANPGHVNSGNGGSGNAGRQGSGAHSGGGNGNAGPAANGNNGSAGAGGSGNTGASSNSGDHGNGSGGTGDAGGNSAFGSAAGNAAGQTGNTNWEGNPSSGRPW